MGSETKKVLVVEDDEDILELASFILESKLGVLTVQATSGNRAITLLEHDPSISLVLCDYNMSDGNGGDVFKYIVKKGSKIPYILCSTEDPNQHSEFKLGKLAGFLEKPLAPQKLLETVKAALSINSSDQKPVKTGSYCRISLLALLKLGVPPCDLYLRLSDEKFVKVVNAGDSFIKADVERFSSKGATHLYLEGKHIELLTDRLEQNLNRLLAANVADGDATYEISQSAHEVIRQTISELGVSEKTRTLIRKSVDAAIRTMRRDQRLSDLMNKLMLDPKSYLSSHSILVGHIACSIAAQIGWDSESTFQKLAMAGFLHDITLKNDEQARINRQSELTSDENLEVLRPADTAAVLEHILEASKIARTFGEMPPDVDVIISQHHERPDGTGWPNALKHTEISPLSAVFIVAHDLVRYVDRHKGVWSMSRFIDDLGVQYSAGLFKKIAQALKIQESTA